MPLKQRACAVDRCGLARWPCQLTGKHTDKLEMRPSPSPPPPTPKPWQQGRGGQSPFPKPCTEPSSKHAGPLFSPTHKKSSITCIQASCLRVFAAVGIPRLKPRRFTHVGREGSVRKQSVPLLPTHRVHCPAPHTRIRTRYVTKATILASALGPRETPSHYQGLSRSQGLLRLKATLTSVSRLF